MVDQAHRPSIHEDFFLQWLHSGTITHPQILQVVELMGWYVYGDKYLLHAVLISLLGGWHIIVQWQPWTWKTTLVRILASVCSFSYARIQCTPDLLPQDVIWWEVFDNKLNDFVVFNWPIVANIVHVDEINRATPKLQSAFLEAMQEQSLTINNKQIALPEPFFVIATQNPYDSVGTYMLPYAQIDRFMVGAYTTWLSEKDEYRLLQKAEQQTMNLSMPPVSHAITHQILAEIKKAIQHMVMPDVVLQHALSCVHTAKLYNLPISTRASKSLLLAAKTWAFLQWKQVVEETDIDSVLQLVLRHRISHIVWKDISPDALYRILTWVAQRDDIAM